MRLRRLTLDNFRCIDNGEVHFPDHAVIVGGNSVGKSTICEALDLVLGPERLARANAIDEHDFHQRQYRDEEGEPVKIEIEVVLTNLSAELERKYRNHREYWDTENHRVLNETATPEDVEAGANIPMLRILFEGVYSTEDDEFKTETFFASPPVDEGERRP